MAGFGRQAEDCGSDSQISVDMFQCGICIPEEKRVTHGRDKGGMYSCAPAARIGGAEAGRTVLQSPTMKEVVVGKVVYGRRQGGIRYQLHYSIEMSEVQCDSLS